ncbi:hypothetical protein AR457_33330 [Streptomyces agglomeratus]|uniref:DUF2252 domain-containing protein n=1 Tax=Streptomyces agglomeratus TaxID=285458 RepID=A0A1E5PK22_9ACTN|nr:DUF2252 domain-containing protein [Streptomyces agglomeratus]OEJ29889.1 hypothetical protein AS594_33220 [Streptomyces agglomeratus]OEJ42096.1 hypothetical protein BGK70_03340 [Streptomyces agglomeratus]OEJ49392.1 hypothetical protein AR457_33330 [Streptomyces agglomeratus]OEJ55404.1 hypothetical protein BGK72_02850 [Streptomyces agglomeratus]
MTVAHAVAAWPSPAERAAYGRNARRRVPRSAHSRLEADTTRPDPVLVIERQSAARLPELVPIRYGRMIESPFRFYRGAAAIMANDLGPLPDTGLTVQLCGDAHLLNFRLLASPERRLVFDINDFDETMAGPFEWDVKRLAASFAIAGRANGFSVKEQNSAVGACVNAYRQRMREFAGMRALDVWYAQDDADRLRELLVSSMGKRARRRTADATARARTRTHLQAFAQLTRDTAEGRRIAPDPPLVTPLRDLVTDASHGQGEQGRVEALLDGYAANLSSERRHLLRQYHLADVARKVVGVGSVGTRCWILLLLGRDDDDPLLLQAKEAQESVLAEHTDGDRYDNQGRRVVAGQRLIQTTSDIFLGWTHGVGLDGQARDFYVRQLRDWKGIARPDTMDSGLLRLFGQLCGACLARAHARSGDPVAIAAYLGGSDRFDRALTTFAQSYADRNERDYEALRSAVRSGRIRAKSL